jgi:hypothetical protein
VGSFGAVPAGSSRSPETSSFRKSLAVKLTVRQKCPNIRHECPNYLRAMCHRAVCFHTHSYFERLFSNIFFAGSPPDIAESIDNAAHPEKIEVFHWK